MAEDNDGGVFLVKQWRYTVKEEVWELPAGSLKTGQETIQTAKEELFEETGVKAGKWKTLGDFYVAVGHESTKAYVVLATDLDTSDLTNDNQEDDESINDLKKYSQGELREAIKTNRIKCGLSIAALNQYFCYKNANDQTKSTNYR